MFVEIETTLNGSETQQLNNSCSIDEKRKKIDSLSDLELDYEDDVIDFDVSREDR